ncbi:MAG: D-sedoheptulose 7-phosphate isomerase [Candidatus Omnitrophica bacterium]|nr:D-sedoheptulose 7-phosphate isomerase [Candidatus Omnitrophota bacterium]
MDSQIKDIFRESVAVSTAFMLEDGAMSSVLRAADIMVKCLKAGNKILTLGNGGSAGDSEHFAAELVVRFEKERRPLPCIALSANSSNLTAMSNDYSFDRVFSRQVEALGVKGDAVLAISTSGNSPNVIGAVKTARKAGMTVIALTGKDGGELKDIADLSILVRSSVTARIQEVHIIVIHALCRLIDDKFV